MRMSCAFFCKRENEPHKFVCPFSANSVQCALSLLHAYACVPVCFSRGVVGFSFTVSHCFCSNILPKVELFDLETRLIAFVCDKERCSVCGIIRVSRVRATPVLHHPTQWSAMESDSVLMAMCNCGPSTV